MVNKFHFPKFWGAQDQEQPASKPILNQAIDDKNAALDDVYSFQNQNQPTVPPKKIKK